jgi:hypothetical protein
MSLEDILRGAANWWKVGDLKAAWRRHPTLLHDQLNEWPDTLDADARRQAEEVVAEWVLGTDESRRYSAMLLIDKLNMVSAAQALNQRAWQLEIIPTLDALTELRRVRRSIERLGAAGEIPRPAETPIETLRREMANHWQLVYDETNPRPDGYDVRDRLVAPYTKFDAEERRMADQILSGWLLSEDSNIRDDAREVIEDCRIGAALPALRELGRRLAVIGTKRVEWEHEKVKRTIAVLSAPESIRTGHRL